MANLRRDDNNELTQKKLAQQAWSLDEAVKLTEVVLAESQALDTPSEEGKARALATAESDVEVVAKKAESPRKRIDTLSTKFHDPAYLRCADYHYIMAPHRMSKTTELPEQWGLLNECTKTVVEAPLKQVKRITQHVLRAIGRVNIRDLMEAYEIDV